ncbi:hypothetical protein FDI24_gp056 [Acidovorax phage ACP17]|uniref:Uncharacterized protein n=1 Tax=Acidovorax phage ACP17 TaxID=2010329 RepID=A0A223AIZ6_9CAUD|nr:hypothetical protein FDI24_gp056 [Acidovorax phage ACP17]ASS33923.1 hypothetical protein [Acidovorax phage ACP17]
MHVKTRWLRGSELLDHIQKHAVVAEPDPCGLFWRVFEPMIVWKKTYSNTGQVLRQALTQLEIPAGAQFYSAPLLALQASRNRFDEDLKMRCSEAKVLRQWTIIFDPVSPVHFDYLDDSLDVIHFEGPVRAVEPRCLRSTPRTSSRYAPDFKYNTGETVIPTVGFCQVGLQCAAGIHFFVNALDALDY